MDQELTPRLPEPSKPQVERVGFGYVATFGKGIVMRVGRLRESRNELSGELVITHPNGWPHTDSGHMFRGRFNLDSPTSRRNLSHVLEKSVSEGANWLYYLELFCDQVLSLERAGPKVVRLGQIPPTAAVGMLITPIFEATGGTVIYSPGGVGKSTLAAAVAVMCYFGKSIVQGWQVHDIRMPLILDYEDGAKAWQDRCAQLARGAGLSMPDISYMECNRPLVDQVEEIAAAAQREEAGMLIIDSAGLAIGASGDYADPSDGPLKFFSAIRTIGLPALVIDHVSSADQKSSGPTAKMYGSVYKWNSARAAWELKREKEPVEGRAELLLLHAKANHFQKHQPIGLEILYTDATINIHPKAVEAEDLAINLSTSDRIARLLSDGAKTDAWLALQLGISEGRIRQVLARDDHRFVRPQRGMIGLLGPNGD